MLAAALFDSLAVRKRVRQKDSQAELFIRTSVTEILTTWTPLILPFGLVSRCSARGRDARCPRVRKTLRLPNGTLQVSQGRAVKALLPSK